MADQQTILVAGYYISHGRGTRGVCEDLSDRLEANGWRVLRTSFRLNSFLRVLDMLWATLRYAPAYDIVALEVYSGRAFIWAEAVGFLLRKLGKPYILTLHGGNLPPFAARNQARVERLLAGADAITTPSHYLHRAMRAYHDGILYLPNAIDLSAYSFQLRERVRPNLVWLRAIHPVYAPWLAAQVIALLKPDYPDIHLTMYGPRRDDAAHRRLQDVIDQHDLQANITIAGSIPKASVPATLQAHDIFINTTTAESFGIAVIEGAACGLPVVTTDVGEIPNIWTHEQDALLVPPDDARAMATAIRRVLDAPTLVAQLSRAGRTTAEQFSWERVLPRWQHLLEMADHDHAHPPNDDVDLNRGE
jgi:glycosyltransferase involved in cell wall biosynthesis